MKYFFLKCILFLGAGGLIGQVPESLAGKWNLITVVDSLHPGAAEWKPSGTTITYYLDGFFGGFDGCNSVGGSFEIEENQIRISAAHSTKRHCPEQYSPGYWGNLPFLDCIFRIQGDRLYLSPVNSIGKSYSTGVFVRDLTQKINPYLREVPFEQIEAWNPSVDLFSGKRIENKSVVHAGWRNENDCPVKFIEVGRTGFEEEKGYQALTCEGGNCRVVPVLSRFKWVSRSPGSGDPGVKVAKLPPMPALDYAGADEIIAVFDGLLPVANTGGIKSPYFGHRNAYQIARWENRWIHLAWLKSGNPMRDLPNRQILDLGDRELVVWATQEKHSFLTLCQKWFSTVAPPQWEWMGDLNGDGAPDLLLAMENASGRVLLLSGPGGTCSWIRMPGLVSNPGLGLGQQNLPGDQIAYRNADPAARATVTVLVMPDGSIRHPRIESAFPDPEMYAAIDSFLKKATFKPGTNSSGKIPASLTFDLDFYEAEMVRSEIRTGKSGNRAPGSIGNGERSGGKADWDLPLCRMGRPGVWISSLPRWFARYSC